LRSEQRLRSGGGAAASLVCFALARQRFAPTLRREAFVPDLLGAGLALGSAGIAPSPALPAQTGLAAPG
jgi:hypothetical protein